MAFETILLGRHESVLTITLNRPQVLNAINFQVISEMESALEESANDPRVRVVVLAGAGRAFCAGDDLKGMSTPEFPGPEDQLEGYREGYPQLMKAVRRLNKPVIARVHGFALGAGCDLILACDLAVAAEDARLGLVFAQRAITSGTALAPKHLPYHKTCEMLFLGDMISASEAQNLGIVNRVVPSGDLDTAVQELASRLAQGPTMTIGYMKEAINLGLGVDIDQAFEYQIQATLLGSMTEDEVEGRKAFLEKRQPSYQGR